MTKKKKKKVKTYSLFNIIITLLFIGVLYLTNLIPNKYLIILSSILLLFSLINAILIKKKKRVGYVFSILFIMLYIIISYYIGVTTSFFSSFSKFHYNQETYLIVVLNDSPYKKINDLKNKDIGYNKNISAKALNKLNNDIEKIEYNEYEKMFSDLDKQNIQSLFVDENYYNIKGEEESLDNYRVIEKIKIRSIIKNENKEVDVTKKAFTIYLSGIDTYGNIEEVSRSDVNILATVNPLTKQVLLTSIPRDSYVTLHGTTGYKDKLTHAGNYGINMSIETIEDLLNIDINYYFRVNFTTFEKIIDALGGVDVYSKYEFISYIDDYQFYKGYNHMNGKQALAFSRERKSLPNGDIDRGENQKAVIEALIRKITSKEIIYKYGTILRELKGTFQTNFTDKDITKLIKQELENIGGWTVTSNTITGAGKYDYTYSYKSQKLYVYELNIDSINNAKDLINSVINNESLETSYNNPSNIKNPTKVIIQSPPAEEKKDNDTEKEKNKNEQKEEDKLTDNNNPLEDLLPKDDDNKQETNEKENNKTTDNNIEFQDKNDTNQNNIEDKDDKIPDELSP